MEEFTDEDMDQHIIRLFMEDKPAFKQGGGAVAPQLVETGGDIVVVMLTIRNQIKLYHWQTGLFSRHKATDELTSKLDENIDTFVEAYMGKYGRPKIHKSIELHNLSERSAREFIESCKHYLTHVLPRKLSKDDTDLLNIRDTILGDLNQNLYLFTLR
jgi:Family of unknown function (DUF5856)